MPRHIAHFLDKRLEIKESTPKKHQQIKLSYQIVIQIVLVCLNDG